MNVTHGSLFSGIGGFDLASEKMGWDNLFHCEWNPFCQKILHYYWPKAEQFTDITKTDFTKYANKIDVLTGGFPCQPYSTAGKRFGKDDERHLWPSMLRAIKEIKPSWVVGENVHGIVNWSGGLVFDQVQTDLENEGYEVQSYILPACAKNAPHRRDRVWFVAYSDSCNDRRTSRCNASKSKEERLQERHDVRQSAEPSQVFGAVPNANERTTGPSRTSGETQSNGSENNDEPKSGREQTEQHFGCSDVYGNDTNANSQRLQGHFQKPRKAKQPIQKKNGSRYSADGRLQDWLNFPTQPPICSGNDGFSSRLDGITFPKWRNESIKAYGNAIVPQVVLEIFKAIQNYKLL